MNSVVHPRRARLKRCQSEVKGLSHEEQKMIERALKESLKDQNKKVDSSDESITTDSPPLNTRAPKQDKNNKRRSNVAKKLPVGVQSKPLKQPKSNKYRKPEDPVYRPCLSAPTSLLPPKPSFKRDSKAITNIKLDMSFESDDDDCIPSFPPSPDSSSNDVIVIPSTSSSPSSSSSSSSSMDSSDVVCDTDQTTPEQSTKVHSPSDYLETAVKKHPQRILFKAVKKSSMMVPLPATALPMPDPLVVPTCKSEKSIGKVFHRSQTVTVKPNAKKRRIQPLAYPVIDHSLISNDDDDNIMVSSSSSSSVEDSDDLPYVSTIQYNSTPSKDSTDKSFYQAQRKFAAYSSPSSVSSEVHSVVVETEGTQSIPSTEDFLLFLCLRSSGKVPESLSVFNTPWTSPHQFHR